MTKNDQHSSGDHQVPSQPSRRPTWPWIAALAIVFIFIFGVVFAVVLPQPDVVTEDAYVRAHYATIAPRVSGQVSRVLVDDTQTVHAGQLLVVLDPADFQVALDTAKARLDQDEAQLAQTKVDITRHPAAVTQAQARLAAAMAVSQLAEQNARRYTRLAGTGAGSIEQRQESDAQLRQADAEVTAAQANLNSTHDQLNGLEAKRQMVQGEIEADRAQIRLAELNLSYTAIRAPIDGIVTQRDVQVGDFISPGSPVLAIVPLQSVYVVANFRELDLHHMQAGQHAIVHVYAYNINLRATVEGIGAASDATFSPVPPTDASGNFTKIVQRLPVRIRFDADQPLVGLLRVGMSVRATVDTHLHDVVGDERRAKE